MPTQLIAALLDATCCVRLATMLEQVGCGWLKFDHFQTRANNSQHAVTHRNTVAKRTQHVAPNNVAICCVDMWRSFGQGLREGIPYARKRCEMSFRASVCELIMSHVKTKAVEFTSSNRNSNLDLFWKNIIENSVLFSTGTYEMKRFCKFKLKARPT